MYPLHFLNRIIPGGDIHDIGNNSNQDRDIHNLLDRYPGHMILTQEEISKGEQILNQIGILSNAKIVCLQVRDSAYLNDQIPNHNWDYHNYRDCEIDNYKLASEYLVDQGYIVIRMGRKVNKSFISNNIGIYDYANCKWASDFMDIYLGFKCEFFNWYWMGCSSCLDFSKTYNLYQSSPLWTFADLFREFFNYY